MEIADAIKQRRSVRKYTDKMPTEEINKIIEAGIWAPSGLNNQPWKFKVCRGDEKDGIAKFTKYAKIIKEAPVAICVFLDNSETYNRDKDIMAVGACIQNMLLAAYESGLGTCWLGEILNKKEEVRKYLKTDSDYELMAVVTLGFPEEGISKGCRKNLKNFILSLLMGIFIFTNVAWAEKVEKEGGAKMKLSSPEFEHNSSIPSRFTCQGENINPPLIIENIPEETKSLALIVDDPDAPMGTWVHWVVFDIPVTYKIEENSVPGKQGINDFKKERYGGPCPPSGTHRYFFKIYALDTRLEFEEGITKEELESAMEDHILDEAELIGLYKKH